jgi:hypothetical protein
MLVQVLGLLIHSKHIVWYCFWEMKANVPVKEMRNEAFWMPYNVWLLESVEPNYFTEAECVAEKRQCH